MQRLHLQLPHAFAGKAQRCADLLQGHDGVTDSETEPYYLPLALVENGQDTFQVTAQRLQDQRAVRLSGRGVGDQVHQAVRGVLPDGTVERDPARVCIILPPVHIIPNGYAAVLWIT